MSRALLPSCRPFSLLGLRAIAYLVLFLGHTAGHASDSIDADMLADAADGRLDHFTLLEGALISGGAKHKSDLAAASRRLDSLWLEVGEPLIDRLSSHDRPRAIFSALHRLVLTGKYDAECTEVQRTLETGNYNCVTASVLYLELCRRHGLQGTAIAVPAHIYCRLLGKQDEDVQTTCKDWFEVRVGKATSPAIQALTRQIATHAMRPRELTDVQLLGKVYYNRGVSQLEVHDYAAAIALLKTSLLLDPSDQPARNNLLAAHNNWALALCDAGKYELAAEKLSLGRAVDADYGPLLTNDLYVHQKWVLHHCAQGRYSAAIELLDQGYERQPDAALFKAGRFAVYCMWSKALLEDNRVREALAILDAARRRYGEPEELISQELQLFESELRRLSQRGEAAAAQALYTAATTRHPQAESLHSLDPEQAASVK
jgi:tetratricopeptide (TPR) repeat protein